MMAECLLYEVGTIILNILDINLMFLRANIIHNIYAKNCAIIRCNNKQRVLNLLHVSAFLCHLQEGINKKLGIYVFFVVECLPEDGLLKTKRRLLYLKTQSVPRCKHFSSRL